MCASNETGAFTERRQESRWAADREADDRLCGRCAASAGAVGRSRFGRGRLMPFVRESYTIPRRSAIGGAARGGWGLDEKTPPVGFRRCAGCLRQ
ncbi:MAG: hypothetical protein D6725_03030 [Planctomycetota bacterium]|nr:MAG: hypothetical protein D6725_03030 [Planctomycetota bacterium]